MSVFSNLKRIAPGVTAFALGAEVVAAPDGGIPAADSHADFSFLYVEFPDAVKIRLKQAELDLRRILAEKEIASAGMEIPADSLSSSPSARVVLMSREASELEDVVLCHRDEQISPFDEEVLDFNFDYELGEKYWTIILQVKTSGGKSARFESTLQLINLIDDGDGGFHRIQTNQLPLALFTGEIDAPRLFGEQSGIIDSRGLDRALFGIYDEMQPDDYAALLVRTRERMNERIFDFVKECSEVAAEVYNIELPAKKTAGRIS